MTEINVSSSNLSQKAKSLYPITPQSNNKWKISFFVIIFLWVLSLVGLAYFNKLNSTGKRVTQLVNNENTSTTIPITSQTPISTTENSVTFKLNLVSTKEYKNKTIGIFSFSTQDDVENTLLYRNYIIAVVKDRNPFINAIPGYINTSLFEGQNVRLCENCFDISEGKIIVINGETNSIGIYEGEFYDDGRNYFINLKTIALPYDSKEVGNLISVKCKDSVCKLESVFRAYLSCSFDYGLAQNTFSNAACSGTNGDFVPTRL